jgi:hypothetical protein
MHGDNTFKKSMTQRSRDFKKLVLFQKIVSIKKEDNENMDEFFTRIKKL